MAEKSLKETLQSGLDTMDKYTPLKPLASAGRGVMKGYSTASADLEAAKANFNAPMPPAKDVVDTMKNKAKELANKWLNKPKKDVQ